MKKTERETKRNSKESFKLAKQVVLRGTFEKTGSSKYSNLLIVVHEFVELRAKLAA